MKADPKTETIPSESDHELRCECGNLVAKMVRSGIELKCRRCKRLAVIPLAWLQGERKQTLNIQL